MKQLNYQIKDFAADVVGVVTSKERLRQLFHTPLYSNALYLMIANAAAPLLGFVFWIIVARFYPPEAVGLATAAIAATGLLAGFSHLGLGMGLIRFLPHSGEKARVMINTVFTVNLLATVVAALVFMAGLSFWSPALLFLRQEAVYLTAFILFTVAHALWILTDKVFIGERRAGFVLSKSLIQGLLKIPLPILLAAFLNSLGIFASWGLSLVIALFISVFLFLPRIQPGYRPRLTVNRGLVNEMVHFSFVNYIADLFWVAPGFILPIMVVNLLGAEPNAYFYMALSIGSVLGMIPGATSLSLFAEGSHEEERLGLNAWRSLKMAYLILVPGVILVVALADKLLLVFGVSYAVNATTLLRIAAITALPSAFNLTYFSVKRVEKRLKVVVGLSAVAAAATLGLAYLLLPRMGINGAGIALLGSQGLVLLVVGASWLKMKRAPGRPGAAP